MDKNAMKIKMLKTENGSVDGIRVSFYEAGHEYDLTNTAGERDLAAAFVGAKLAAEMKEEPEAQTASADDAPPVQEKAAPDPENQTEPESPENKAMQIDENKKSGKRKG